MSTTTPRAKCITTALGAAMVSAAVVASPAPAHAEDCTQWEFNGNFNFVMDKYPTSIFTVPAKGTHFDGKYTQGLTFPIQGDITGNTVSMMVGTYAQDPYLWTGQIDPAGNVTGTGNIFPDGPWRSLAPSLVCTKTATPPPPEITLRYDAPTLVGITGWVGMTNNAGKPAVDCTYHDGVLPPRPLSVYGDKETRIDLPGIPTGHLYNITVKCGDLTHSEQKRF